MENRFNESDSTKGVTGIAVAVYTVVILALLVFGALLVYGGVFGVNWCNNHEQEHRILDGRYR